MNKICVFALVTAIVAGAASVSAAGGSASDPLVSQKYVEQTYKTDVLEQSDQRIDKGLGETFQTALGRLDLLHSDRLQQIKGEEIKGNKALLDQRYKRGDVLSLPTGSSAMLLLGDAVAGYTSSGAVIDVTTGAVLKQGEALLPQHRCLIGENTTAAVTITSDTAVISTEGPATLFASDETDYNALADGLKSMGLFRGANVGYGSGYQLELIPTRVEGLVMFLRLIGEESAALDFKGQNPFVDVPAWADRYTAYAYEKGYTKGVGTDSAGKMHFGPANTMSSGEYITFLLRSLGYSDSGDTPDFAWNTAIESSVAFGVLTRAEASQFTDKPFLRAQVVYASYFAMNAPRKDGGTLLTWLANRGAIDQKNVEKIMSGISVPRMK